MKADKKRPRTVKRSKKKQIHRLGEFVAKLARIRREKTADYTDYADEGRSKR